MALVRIPHFNIQNLVNLRVTRPWAAWHADGDAFEEVSEAPAYQKNSASVTFQARAPKGELCKFWVNSGRCPLKQCDLKHVEGEERRLAQQAFLKARLERRVGAIQTQSAAERRVGAMQTQSAAVGDSIEPHGKQKKKFRARISAEWLVETFGKETSFRARIFAEWLVDTFGKETLCRGGGVLDIAGGVLLMFGKEILCQGWGVLDIAGGKGEVTQHLISLGVPSTVVDPRVVPPRSEKKKAAASSHRQITELFDEALWESGEHRETILSASALIGMHPDQATEPIVSLALSLGKPFAVVPCCVFPRESARRRQVGAGPAGDLVVTYPEFVDYLQERHASMQRSCLAFQGRNVVLHLQDSPPEMGQIEDGA
ncbi:hypothetical protein T484DRAFT_1765727 [Baffinella frigidus]|nr:hypothetical protein T484DRAFT_1765727 [Cryptophyta sp. CCMP2293]